MATLTILRGVSGSGKSTWARQQNAVVVSRDDIRHTTLGIPSDVYYKADKAVLFEREQLVTSIEHAMIKAALKAGKDVISDNTNIQPKFAQKLADLAYGLGAEVKVKTFETVVGFAINNVRLRALQGGRNVDEEVIRKQASALAGTRMWEPVKPYIPKPYTGTPGKPKAVLVDIDGTLAHMRDYRGPFEWHNVGKDDPDLNVMQVITWIREGMKADVRPWENFADRPKVILMSGRDESCRQITYDWTVSWDFNFDALYMRPEGDMRKDSIVKAELFDKHIRDNYDVVMVFDDRNQVVDMWRLMGLQVAQVAEGDF